MWSYDASNLNITTASGRLNSVRLLIGDTDTTDQQLQDEEVTFSLSLVNSNIYAAALWCCNTLASKYSRLVDTKLDGALESKYSTLSKQYSSLATTIDKLAKRYSGSSLGVAGGGISVSEVENNRLNTDRVKPDFVTGQFDVEEVVGYNPYGV